MSRADIKWGCPKQAGATLEWLWGGRIGLRTLISPTLSSLKAKWQKNSDSCTEERSKSDHMLACGLGLMFPALMKAVSLHHEGSKVNRVSAKSSHEGTLYETGNQKWVVVILIRYTLSRKQDLNLPEAWRDNQPRCDLGSISPALYVVKARGIEQAKPALQVPKAQSLTWCAQGPSTSLISCQIAPAWPLLSCCIWNGLFSSLKLSCTPPQDQAQAQLCLVTLNLSHAGEIMQPSTVWVETCRQILSAVPLGLHSAFFQSGHLFLALLY